MPPEDDKNLNTDDQETDDNGGQTSAETENPENDHMIPKTRFDEVNTKLNQALAEIKKMKADADKKERDRLEAEGNIKELYDKALITISELQPKADKLEGYETALSQALDSEIASIPKDKRSLIPSELPVEAQLRWLSQNRSLLAKAPPEDLGAGNHGGGEPPEDANLSEEEKAFAISLGMKPEEYAKYKREGDGAPTSQ